MSNRKDLTGQPTLTGRGHHPRITLDHRTSTMVQDLGSTSLVSKMTEVSLVKVVVLIALPSMSEVTRILTEALRDHKQTRSSVMIAILICLSYRRALLTHSNPDNIATL